MLMCFVHLSKADRLLCLVSLLLCLDLECCSRETFEVGGQANLRAVRTPSYVRPTYRVGQPLVEKGVEKMRVDPRFVANHVKLKELQVEIDDGVVEKFSFFKSAGEGRMFDEIL
jgi:hypothetical protein